MNLRHYSDKPIKEIYSCVQDCVDKPKGFWVSDESDMGWREWSKENFGDVEYSVIIKEDSNILYITNSREIEKFTEDFSCYPYKNVRLQFINWQKVSEHYDGIIITPYIWSHRMDEKTTWYYGWDCASGCIWNKEAIERIERIGQSRGF